MDTIDIMPTPEACRQIARLFRAQQARSEEMAVCAERARDALDDRADDEISPWDRVLLAAAFEALVGHAANKPGMLRRPAACDLASGNAALNAA